MPSFTKYGLEYKYATEQEVLDFANKVREAGGGEVIDELLPAYAGAPNQCLIAKALNFDCSVYPTGNIDGVYPTGNIDDPATSFWIMDVDSEVADKIADATGCEVHYRGDDYSSLKLPELIGNAAHAFDCAKEADAWVVKYREAR